MNNKTRKKRYVEVLEISIVDWIASNAMLVMENDRHVFAYADNDDDQNLFLMRTIAWN